MKYKFGKKWFTFLHNLHTQITRGTLDVATVKPKRRPVQWQGTRNMYAQSKNYEDRSPFERKVSPAFEGEVFRINGISQCTNPSIRSQLPISHIVWQFDASDQRGLVALSIDFVFGTSKRAMIMVLSTPLRWKNGNEKPQITVNVSHPLRSNCLRAANHVPTGSVN